MKSLSFYISKRAKIIEPPQKLVDEIYNWAKGVLSRLIVNDENLNIKHPTELVDIEKLKSDAKKFATNEPAAKTFKVNLKGWKYEDKFPSFLQVNVKLSLNGNTDYMALWDASSDSIILYYRPSHTIDLTFNRLKTAISHELIHLFQDYRLDGLGLPLEFGLPKRKVREPAQNIYEGRDIEFYPLLLSNAKSISRWLNKMDKDLWPKVFKTFIGMNKPFLIILNNGNKSEIKPQQIFKYLKENNKEKWKIAVKFLYTYLKENIGFGG